MHELSVTQNLLDLALQHGKSSNASQITDLYLVLGEFASIVDDSVQFYWDFMAEGTIAEGAQLHFTRIPARLRCLDCQIEYEPGNNDPGCPECNGAHVQIINGREFFLESINIQT